MPSDFFVALAFLPMTIGLAILVCAYVLIRKTRDAVTWRNILHGYLGLVVALLAYAAVDTLVIGFEKVARGDIAQSELSSWLPQWSLYMFYFMGPFLLVISTIVGLPLFLLLKRLGFASIAGVLFIALAYPVGWSVYFGVTNNWWCEAATQHCGTDAFLTALTPSLVLALGFAATAGLPLLRNRQNAI